MITIAHPVTFCGYQATDYSSVASLWTRINRELAPVGMEKLFEQYIAMTIDGELKQLLEVFSGTKRNAFRVVASLNGLSVRLVSKAAASATLSFVGRTSIKATAG
jgi:hypothetical protein